MASSINVKPQQRHGRIVLHWLSVEWPKAASASSSHSKALCRAGRANSKQQQPTHTQRHRQRFPAKSLNNFFSGAAAMASGHPQEQSW
eukprot:scaffold616314_cov48-Prasinocladus_malaysianus.AAC.1